MPSHRTMRISTMRTWEELVAAGQKAVSGYQWELGDLASEVETGYGESSLANYAAEVGTEYSTLKDYRAVSAAYPEKDGRPSNWSVASAFRAQDDRLDLLSQKAWTVAEARALVQSRKVPVPPPAPPVPPQPAQSPEDDFTLDDLSLEPEDQPVPPASPQMQPPSVTNNPVSQKTASRIAAAELVQGIDRFTRWLAAAMTRVGPLPEGDGREFLKQSVQAAQERLDDVRQYSETGVSPVDQEIADLLGGEEAQ